MQSTLLTGTGLSEVIGEENVVERLQTMDEAEILGEKEKLLKS
jgi:hypothetical protein